MSIKSVISRSFFLSAGLLGVLLGNNALAQNASAATEAASATPAVSVAAAAPAATATTAAAPTSCPAVLKQSFKRLQDEAPQDLCQYAGKVVLVVNTASYCGYTSQYEGLEKLYAKYSPRGLVVLGFPSNDFEQEPGEGKQIAEFCFNTYGVKFPMFGKTSVKGDKANGLYAYLARTTGKQPAWNFNKYLIDRSGNTISYFPSKVTPDNRELVEKIETALGN